MSLCRYDTNVTCSCNESTIQACINCVLDKITGDIQSLRDCSCSCSDGIIDSIEDILDHYRKKTVCCEDYIKSYGPIAWTSSDGEKMFCYKAYVEDPTKLSHYQDIVEGAFGPENIFIEFEILFDKNGRIWELALLRSDFWDEKGGFGRQRDIGYGIVPADDTSELYEITGHSLLSTAEFGYLLKIARECFQKRKDSWAWK